MKPPPFEFYDPLTSDAVMELLVEYGDEAKILAGGQSLIPLLSFRLARPEVLVDINRVEQLAYISHDRAANFLRIGALTRQAQAEHSPEVASACPLLRRALKYVAHPQIRNRGTIGGSAAHADPAAEIPVVLVAAEATIVSRRGAETRRTAAGEFFRSHLTTTLEDDELLLSVDIPATPSGTGSAFEEFARRSGDFALGGAAALITVNPESVCTRARLVLLAAADVPLRVPAAERILEGRAVSPDAAREAAATAVLDAEPMSDIHGDAAYRLRVIEAMCAQAIMSAFNDVTREEAR